MSAPYIGAPDDSDGKSFGSLAERQRPGLGTGFGDKISAEMSYASFSRASKNPAGLESIYYNDKEGVDAMKQALHASAGMQKAANGLVEWGIKNDWRYAKNYNDYRFNGGDRKLLNRYVVGKKGGKYSIVVRNLCKSRLELVLSVDGLDVVDGKAASLSKRGYIVAPGKTLEVKGFRTSEEAVAAFEYSSMNRSYSNLKHETTRNVGVIGMAVFTEKGVDPWKWTSQRVEARKSARAFAEAPQELAN